MLLSLVLLADECCRPGFLLSVCSGPQMQPVVVGAARPIFAAGVPGKAAVALD